MKLPDKTTKDKLVKVIKTTKDKAKTKISPAKAKTKPTQTSQKTILALAFAFVILVSLIGGALSDRIFGYKLLDKWFPRKTNNQEQAVDYKLVKEESVVIEVVEKVSPSVVTVGIKRKNIVDPFKNFLDPFDFFGSPNNLKEPEEIEQDIGSGFIISEDGLIVTNKHVVGDLEGEYKVITKDDQEYQVEKIYRDPGIDLAILKIDAKDLEPAKLGDSDQLKVGQYVIAIGTALGEFRNTVTTGVISGLGRGLAVGDPFQGYTEELENVIQTDAAINPGNSGGPLLNSAGQVIGVNVAVTQGAENIGFAIPINVVSEALDNFNKTGKFERPFLGVRYKMIAKDLALLNDVPEGAYIVDIIPDSPAEKAGLQKSDIITKIDNKKIKESNGLAKIIQTKKIGDKVDLEVWRDGEDLEMQAILEGSQ